MWHGKNMADLRSYENLARGFKLAPWVKVDETWLVNPKVFEYFLHMEQTYGHLCEGGSWLRESPTSPSSAS